MIEKQEAEEFDDADDADLDADSVEEEVDIARLTRDMDVVRRRAARPGSIPALRKLELLAEQKRTRELTSDFDDYDLDEPERRTPARVRMGTHAR